MCQLIRAYRYVEPKRDVWWFCFECCVWLPKDSFCRHGVQQLQHIVTQHWKCTDSKVCIASTSLCIITSCYIMHPFWRCDALWCLTMKLWTKCGWATKDSYRARRRRRRLALLCRWRSMEGYETCITTYDWSTKSALKPVVIWSSHSKQRKHGWHSFIFGWGASITRDGCKILRCLLHLFCLLLRARPVNLNKWRLLRLPSGVEAFSMIWHDFKLETVVFKVDSSEATFKMLISSWGMLKWKLLHCATCAAAAFMLS